MSPTFPYLIVSILVAALSSWTAVRVARIERGVTDVRRSTVEPADDGPRGSLPLIERVRLMDETSEARWDWTRQSVEAIGREVGADLEEPPRLAPQTRGGEAA